MAWHGEASWCCLALLTLPFFFSKSAAAANLVANGGFEASLSFRPSWTLSQSPQDKSAGTVGIEAGIGRGASNAAVLGPSFVASIQQNVTTTKGQSYALSFWLKGDATAGRVGAKGISFSVAVTGGASLAIPMTGLVSGASFRLYTLQFLAVSSATNVKFSFLDTSDALVLDDISVTAVASWRPPPQKSPPPRRQPPKKPPPRKAPPPKPKSSPPPPPPRGHVVKPLTPGMTFSWDLTGGRPKFDNPSRVFDIDGFEASASDIADLHRRGKIVICYFSFGSYETGRPDSTSFDTSLLGSKLCKDFSDASGKCLEYWPGERWLNTRLPAVRSILQKRIDRAAQKGCDGIEPDNTDAYENGGGGFKPPLTQNDARDFLKWLAAEVHKRKMTVALKNTAALAEEMAAPGLFDFAVVEQCNQYTVWGGDRTIPDVDSWPYSCDPFNAFVINNKLVYVAEYPDASQTFGEPPASRKKMCVDNNKRGFTTQVLDASQEVTGKVLYDCSLHAGTNCATCWKKCRGPSELNKWKSSYAIDPDNAPPEPSWAAFGDCIRSCNSCTLV